MPNADKDVIATCHCGSVSIRLSTAPAQVTQCNCSVCRRYGALWAYVRIADATIVAKNGTDTYAWADENIDFNRCTKCGCVTHWFPRDASRDSFGINARLLDQTILDAADVNQVDSAGSGLFH